MARFRLRLHATEINLPIGDLLIGRGPECFLRINEPMVSRRHARLSVTRDRAVVEDLGSRNGTHVNGIMVLSPLELRPADLLIIGTQQFSVEVEDDPRSRPTEVEVPVVSSGVSATAAHSATSGPTSRSGSSLPAVGGPSSGGSNPHLSSPSSSNSSLRPGLSGPHATIQIGPGGRTTGPHQAVPGAAPPMVTAPQTVLPFGTLDPPSQPGTDFAVEWPSTTAGKDSATHLFWGLSDRILAMGRVEEAERMMGPKLQELLRRVETGQPPEASAIADALRRSLRLATATRKDVWFGWMFEYARVSRYRMEPAFLDEIYAQMFTCRPAVGAQILAYAQTLEDEAVILRLVTLRRLCRE